MKYIILHNIHDKLSRDFIETLSNKKNDEYEIIDWYEDEAARFKYTGPPASAFPSVVWELEDGRYYMARLPANWQEVDLIVAASNAKEPNPKLSYCEKDIEYLGGQRISEIEALVKAQPYYFKDIESIKANIETCKQELEKQTLEEYKELSHEEKVEKIKEVKDTSKEVEVVGMKAKIAFSYHNFMDKFNSETESRFFA